MAEAAARMELEDYFISFNMIFEQDLGPYPKLVYINLSRRADCMGQSFPSRQLIAKDCQISVKSVDRALKTLVGAGLLVKHARRKDKSCNYTNLYSVLRKPSAPSPEAGAPQPARGSVPQTPGVASHSPQGSVCETPGSTTQEVIHTKREREPEAAPAPAANVRAYGSYKKVRLTDADYSRLQDKFGRETADDYIDQLDRAIASERVREKGIHSAVIESWILRDRKKPAAGQARAEERPRPRNRFVNFPQREWDFEEIERISQQQLIDEVAEIKAGKK